MGEHDGHFQDEARVVSKSAHTLWAGRHQQQQQKQDQHHDGRKVPVAPSARKWCERVKIFPVHHYVCFLIDDELHVLIGIGRGGKGEKLQKANTCTMVNRQSFASHPNISVHSLFWMLCILLATDRLRDWIWILPCAYLLHQLNYWQSWEHWRLTSDSESYVILSALSHTFFSCSFLVSTREEKRLMEKGMLLLRCVLLVTAFFTLLSSQATNKHFDACYKLHVYPFRSSSICFACRFCYCCSAIHRPFTGGCLPHPSIQGSNSTKSCSQNIKHCKM